MAEWFSFEVMNGATSAREWAEGAIDGLIVEALGAGALDSVVHHHPWGFVFEVEFADDAAFERYRQLPSVTAALERVPDPLNGLFVHPGRGGSSGTRRPLRPLPFRGSGSVALPLPDELFDLDLDPTTALDRRLVGRGMPLLVLAGDLPTARRRLLARN